MSSNALASDAGGLSRLQRIVQLATSRNDLVLAAFLVAVIFMMILPLPTWLVDLLIGTNMTISAILLMVAMAYYWLAALPIAALLLLIGVLVWRADAVLRYVNATALELHDPRHYIGTVMAAKPVSSPVANGEKGLRR